MPKIFITGATGRLGAAVLKLVPEATPLTRKPQSLGSLGTSRGVVTDFSTEQLSRILKDADVLIHLAGSVNTVDSRELKEANVELTRRLMHACPKRCRVIFASSISVYGKKLMELLADENTSARPDSSYSRSKYDAERLVISTHLDTYTIFRIGTIYGPGFEDYFRVLKVIEGQKMSIIGSGTNHIPFVHVDDIAKTIANAVTRSDAGGIYVLAGDPELTQEQIYSVAAKALGVPAPKKHINLAILLLAATWSELKYRFTKKKPSLSKEHVYVLAYDRVFNCSKAKREFGFSPRSLEQGIIGMVREYRGLKKG